MKDKLAYVNWYPLSGSQMTQFIKPRLQPPLRPEALSAHLYLGDERDILKTPITGDMSIAVRYKGDEGFIMSAETTSSDLSVVQLQGARSRESYRVNSGFDSLRFSVDQILQIAQHPESPFERLTMPDLSVIPGLVDSGNDVESVMKRYLNFIAQALLQYSQHEHQYVRDIR